MQNTPATPPPTANPIPMPVPPEEQFWKRYSPHHEAPLSGISSVATHIVLILMILLIAWVASKVRDEDENRWTAVHHPFTRPTAEGAEVLDRDPGKATAHAYDLVGNGLELAGGSFRIHEPDIQARVFDLLGITAEQQRAKFGFLLDALAMGAPPHGGIASGIDRMMMVLAGEPNLRDTIAFPKNQAGVDPMSGAPTRVEEEQLAELGIRVVVEDEAG